MRSPLRLTVLALASVLVALALSAPASAATPSCGTTWGSLTKGAIPVAPAAGITLTGVRAGRHTCYDRLIIDLKPGSAVPSYRVEYVPAVTEDPSGRSIPLRGGAYLLITAGASDHTPAGQPTYTPANRRELAGVPGYRTFRQVAWAGSFEGVTSVGLGVRARLPFRAFILDGPAGRQRLVVDVAHTW